MARADTVASDGDASASTGSAALTVVSGTQLGRYLLGDELGAGGMATVYRARDHQLRRDVAVKVLFPHLARKDELTRRFQREARAAAGLEHPNILRVYDVGAGASGPYIVMELVRGQSLRDLVEADDALLAELVACIGALLCDGLAVAHAAGIVHRDVKPGNVMLADDGRLLLADFGVARLDGDDSLVTRTGALLGTVSFMAPEQAQGDAVDARSDLYSVGVTLYQLATGALPFHGGTAKILADATRGAMPALRRKPAIGAELSRLIGRLMAPAPADRPADATTVAAELRSLARAGGLGDPADELRAFALDRAAYLAQRTPIVVARTVARAEEAAARRAISTALALCDRALALAPTEAAAIALVARLTRTNSHRRAIVIGALALAVAGVATGGGLFLRDRMRAASSAAAPATVTDSATATDSATVTDTVTVTDSATATVTDPVTVTVTDPVTVTVTVPPVDAARPTTDPRLRLDASTGRDASPAIAPALVDAAPPPPLDAAPAAPVPSPVLVTFAFDTWCDLTIDGTAHGRADASPIPLLPGGHRVECKQGLGQGAWSDTITVVAGTPQRITASLLPPILVENAIADAVVIRGVRIARGATASLRPGRQRVEIVRGGKVAASGWVTLPRLTRCTLRDTPELDCYP